ncbi:hypothetical protein STEG23_013689 [Scotinomys teguina]
MTATPLGWDQDCSLKIREPEVPAPFFGSWILEVGARPPRLDCISSSLESVPCPFHLTFRVFISSFLDTIFDFTIIISNPVFDTSSFSEDIAVVIQMYEIQGSSFGQFSVDIQMDMKSSTDSTPAK